MHKYQATNYHIVAPNIFSIIIAVPFSLQKKCVSVQMHPANNVR